MRSALALILLVTSVALTRAASHSKSATCSAHVHDHGSVKHGKSKSGVHHRHGRKKKKPQQKPQTSQKAVIPSSSSPAVAPLAPLPAANASVPAIGAPLPAVSAAGAAKNATSSAVQSLIQVTDPACGSTGATLQSSADSGPNGAADWLSCGISKQDPNSGWTPPHITMSQLIVKELSEFTSTTFSNCAPYLSLFEKSGAAHGLPAIFLAAFAMQESSCEPNANGDSGGAFGLMQITADKCGGAPNGNCYDPAYNIETGASYFAGQLASFGGDILKSIGQYNGWQPGLTYAQATAAANSGCCDCQQNLDYLNQFLNFWIQGKTPGAGLFNNLAVCGS